MWSYLMDGTLPGFLVEVLTCKEVETIVALYAMFSPFLPNVVFIRRKVWIDSVCFLFRNRCPVKVNEHHVIVQVRPSPRNLRFCHFSDFLRTLRNVNRFTALAAHMTASLQLQSFQLL